ncbi:uncharacterized protein MONBRDRAFT_15671 [Monosiga brevicollis MX1]|uniref:WASH complex subunit 7 n=1 Tax=Monosiga brevicollis TaxID=81824 RepID=A9UV80_MONBE|nr:uncharacterized protein MONBRDRAFT_15671 [Monosiga brevicollis MX1]EDQ91034.1 predicted protein [Monosiga brevicollis MX1]|eukprot:XP_001744331.1 hypothetical protein [Monosiga brevicollis MX1]
MKEFLDTHAQQLVDVEDVVDDAIGDGWDLNLDPIALDTTPHEAVDVVKLVWTENQVSDLSKRHASVSTSVAPSAKTRGLDSIFSKVMATFVALCNEMQLLQREAEEELYAPLHIYGEGMHDGQAEQEGDAQLCFAKMLPVLQHLATFTSRVVQVVKNVVQQFAMMYTSKISAQTIDPRGVHLHTVFRNLGNLLMCMATLDEILFQNAILARHKDHYKLMLKHIKSHSEQFQTTREQLMPFEQFLKILEGLQDGMLFQRCVDQCFDDDTVMVSPNTILQGEFLELLRLNTAALEARVGTPKDRRHRNDFMGLVCNYILFETIFRSQDRRMLKSIWDLQKQLPAVHIYGTIVVMPNDFILQKLPHLKALVDKKFAQRPWDRPHAHAFAAGHLTRSEAQNIYRRVVAWMVQFDAKFRPEMSDMEMLEAQSNFLLQGLLFAYQIRHLLTTFLVLHAELQVKLNSAHVREVLRLAELLKAIQQTYHRRSLFVAQAIQQSGQHLAQTCTNLVTQAYDQSTKRANLPPRELDVQSALELLRRCCIGPSTRLRKLACEVAVHIATGSKQFPPAHVEKFLRTRERLDMLHSLRDEINRACDASFFYWHRHLFGLYLRDMYREPLEAYRLPYMMATLQDCAIVAKRAQDSTGEPILTELHKEIFAELQQHIIEPLCLDIEEDLRFQALTDAVHRRDKESRNPLKAQTKDLVHFLRLNPLRFNGDMLNIKREVTHYLDRTFYNLTTVSLSLWANYAKMRSVAAIKYGLDMQETHLPSQTLEQGLDVLEIMRNIHTFVSRYNYNLNNQIFVQKSSPNKHLNTINIQHIANSIRTHGTGIMNTTVNFTYQFLRKRFFTFSQFLFDDHIKSRLLKDCRFFRENRDELDQQYPFERAEKFNRGIRKLGVKADGRTYLDRFRELITEIGNGMAYIRMIRSGGLNMCSNSIRFLPDVTDVESFVEMLEEAGAPEPDTLQAARNLDAVVNDLVQRFAEGSDYFKMLVDIFAKEFRADKNAHLKNFYMMVPPLTVNYVEHMISAKDRITKKNKDGASFTDDGFAMGIAYILKLLDQYEAFDSLHWFQACRAHYQGEKSRVVESKRTQRDDGKLQEAMSLSLKRVERYQREMDMLFFSLSSARIFFRADKVIAHALVNL